jgi:spermidine synthase
LYGFSYTDFFQTNVVEIIYDYAYSWLWAIVIYTLTCALIFLLPTMIMGISFPLINELFFKNDAAKAGKAVSAVYAINTIGCIAGSLGAGAILIPAFGIKTSIFVIAALNLGLGFIFIATARHKILPTLGLGAALLLLIVSLSADGQYLFGRKEKKEDRVLFYKEGLMATVKVYERNADLFMSIDGVSIASTDKVLLKKEKLIGHLPFFVKPDIKKALAVGLASGISVGSITLHPNLESIDCVELIKPVFPAAAYFSKYNQDIFSNKKVKLIYDDVYAYLKYNTGQYDLISSDGKLDPLHSANTIMLSADYYELCKTRMKPDGLFIQWLPITTPHLELQVILDTLKKSFKHVALFFFYPTDFYMLAADVPIILDKAHMEQVFANAPIQQELAAFNVRDAAAIFSSFIGTYESPHPDHVRLNSFNQPILEFEYMREWKKSRAWTGGYRAKNLRYLTEKYEKTNLDSLSAMTKNIEPPALANTFKASLLFFKGAVKYFETGNPATSFQDYRKFQTEAMETN